MARRDGNEPASYHVRGGGWSARRILLGIGGGVLFGFLLTLLYLLLR